MHFCPLLCTKDPGSAEGLEQKSALVEVERLNRMELVSLRFHTCAHCADRLSPFGEALLEALEVVALEDTADVEVDCCCDARCCCAVERSSSALES